MSDSSLQTAGIILVIVPTIQYGGYTLLRHLTRVIPGYLDNPARRGLFTAGHAHAGVLVILALVGVLYVDSADLSDGAKTLVRSSLAFAPIFMSAGFFLSVASPKATRPNRLILHFYLGALSLLVGVLTLGIGLIRAA
jgi:hypothetical protein